MFQLVSAVFLRSVIWGLLAVFFKTQPLWRTWQSHRIGHAPRHDIVGGGASPRCVRAWRLPHHGWQCPWSTFYLDIFAEDCRRQSKQVKVRTIVCCLVWSKEIFKFIQRKKKRLPPLLDTPIPQLHQSQMSLLLTLFNGLLTSALHTTILWHTITYMTLQTLIAFGLHLLHKMKSTF